MTTYKPLVPISLMTYNQEKHARDMARGVPAQTYEPLEIVNDEVDRYKASGGAHKNIVLNNLNFLLGVVMELQVVLQWRSCLQVAEQSAYVDNIAISFFPFMCQMFPEISGNRRILRWR